jgi:MFS family permease
MGGAKRRIHGALSGWIVYCLLGNILFGLGRGLNVWIPSILVAGLGSNIGIATSQAILQAKVEPDLQGRVFSARRMLTWFPDTFTPILGGLLIDKVMEPAMNSETWVARNIGWMVGNSPGSGMALIMVVFGLLTIITMLSGYLVPEIRNIEDLLPDHDQLPKAEIQTENA